MRKSGGPLIWIRSVSFLIGQLYIIWRGGKKTNKTKQKKLHAVLLSEFVTVSAFHYCQSGESCSRHQICHSHPLLIQSRRKIAFISYMENDPRLHLQFIIWTERPGTAGLNKSVVATGFTHDFPVRAVFVPLSSSHRFHAWNTKSKFDTDTETPDQIRVSYFSRLFLKKRASLKWQLLALRSCWLVRRGETWN